jgi:putative N-acetylmannosamine-6-phosphate epimerase
VLELDEQSVGEQVFGEGRHERRRDAERAREVGARCWTVGAEMREDR